jgi:hypothetical protein
MPPAITYHGRVYQQLLGAVVSKQEIPCKDIDTILSPWGPDVKTECFQHFFDLKYVAWTSDKHDAIRLTGTGKAAYATWFAKPDPDENGNPKPDFM